MAVAQCGSGMLHGQARVGFLNHLAQQESLREGLKGPVLRARSVADVPAGVLNHPVVVDFILREQVVEGYLLAQLGALDV